MVFEGPKLLQDFLKAHFQRAFGPAQVRQPCFGCPVLINNEFRPAHSKNQQGPGTLEGNLPGRAATTKGKHLDAPPIGDKEKKELFHSFRAHFHLGEGGLQLCNVLHSLGFIHQLS